MDHIPLSTANNRRPGYAMTPTTITIHNTGNPISSARNERNWLTNPSNHITASYHIVIDEHEAIECLPLNEVAWHAGDGGSGPGNRTSIGIEICESGNYDKTLDHAALLVAKMLKERGWGVEQLRKHFDWSGKICPRLMYENGEWSGWEAFKDSVRVKLTDKEEYEMKPEDANKIIRYLSAGWFTVQGNKEAEKEFNRLANELRKVSGQKEQ